MRDEEWEFDGSIGYVEIKDFKLGEDDIREAVIELENNSSIAYRPDDTPEIETPKPLPHEQSLPHEQPGLEMAQAILRDNQRQVSLDVGGHVEIECRMSYERFLRL